MLANSLFGKFAQRSSTLLHRPDIVAPDAYCTWAEVSENTPTTVRFISIGWNVFQQVESGETESSFPAISSFVASYARQYMTKVREIAGVTNCNYQGVDCLIITQNGYDRMENAGLLHATEPGKFKIVDAVNSCEIRGTCDYTIGNRNVVGRTPRKVAERQGDKVRVTKFYPPRPDCGLRPLASVYESDEWLTLSKVYRKGTTQDYGWIVPLKFPLKHQGFDSQTPF